MKQTLNLNVGAKIGWMSLITPFARLIVSQDSLELNASLFGCVVFSPSDVSSIEPADAPVFWGNAFRINHQVPGYPRDIRFFSHKKPKEVMKKLEASGFLEKSKHNEKITSNKIKAKQESGRYPLKKNVAITTILILVMLLGYDIFMFATTTEILSPFGLGFFIALSFLLLTSVLSIFIGHFRKMILKKNRGFKDIDRAMYILIIMIFVIFSTNLYLGNFHF